MIVLCEYCAREWVRFGQYDGAWIKNDRDQFWCPDCRASEQDLIEKIREAITARLFPILPPTEVRDAIRDRRRNHRPPRRYP